MTTGLRSKTAAWLKAHPDVRPEAGRFGVACETACILGAALQAVSNVAIDESGFIRVGGSKCSPFRAAQRLGLPVDLVEDISVEFDRNAPAYKGHNKKYTWKDALKLLPD